MKHTQNIFGNNQSKSMIFAVIFLIASSLFHPLIYLDIFFDIEFRSYVNFISIASLAMLAIALCSFNVAKAIALFRANVVPSIMLCIIVIGCLIRLYWQQNGIVEYFFISVAYIALPLCVAINHRAFEKLLPLSLATLGIVNLIFSTKDLITGELFCGIAGNWNWNAALLVTTSPFVIWEIFYCLKKNKIAAIIISSVFSCIVFLYLCLCDSKGAWLALVVALFFCYFWKSMRKKIIVWLGTITALFLLLALVFAYSEYLPILLTRDVRIYLWEGVIRLISENALLGVGQPLFESAYAPFKPTEYFMNVFATDRTNHPHNHFLFFCASNGVLAFVAWLVLLFYPLWEYSKHLNKAGWNISKLYIFAILFLLIHGQLDILLEVWPTNVIFLVILGIIWGRTMKLPKIKQKNNFWKIFVGAVCCATLLILMSIQVYRDLISSYYYRVAHIKRNKASKQEALQSYDKSISVKPTPEGIYQAALIALYDFKNPKLCKTYLEMLYPMTAFSNYVSNNGVMAKTFYLLGNKRESLEYFKKEAQNFPLSSVNWYFYYNTLKELGHNEEAQVAYDNLLRSLTLKGLHFEHIPLLIKNPRWDMHFREVSGVDLRRK
jgi:O-antigen ligase